MNGPEHYREAEQLLNSADVAIGQFEEHGWEGKRLVAEGLTAQAQVHATLAQVAATADLFALAGPQSGQSADAWQAVLQ